MNVVRPAEFPKSRGANENFLMELLGTKIPADALMRRAEGKSPSPNPPTPFVLKPRLTGGAFSLRALSICIQPPHA
jgi:hypothetical protein